MFVILLSTNLRILNQKTKNESGGRTKKTLIVALCAHFALYVEGLIISVSQKFFVCSILVAKEKKNTTRLS